MNIIKIEGISEAYPERIEGTMEWYFCKVGKDGFCDLYEAEEIVKAGNIFPGMTCHLIHYSEGTVYSLFELEENVYVEQPVWDNGKLYFLRVDFIKQIIQIYSCFPDNQMLEIIKELALGILEDCYNLMLKVSPLMLCRDANNGIYEIVWPENIKIEIGQTEGLLFREGEDLYFSEWYENPEYHENVIIRDLNSGAIKEKYQGYLCRMPNGVYWRI
ncbi:MAG: hypothetical protein ACERKN_18265 [Velocimicrobium sp.]